MSTKTKLTKFLSEGDLKSFFAELKKIDKSPDVILLNQRYKTFEKEYRLGVVAHQDYILEKNKLTKDCLSYLEDFREPPNRPVNYSKIFILTIFLSALSIGIYFILKAKGTPKFDSKQILIAKFTKNESMGGFSKRVIYNLKNRQLPTGISVYGFPKYLDLAAPDIESQVEKAKKEMGMEYGIMSYGDYGKAYLDGSVVDCHILTVNFPMTDTIYDIEAYILSDPGEFSISMVDKAAWIADFIEALLYYCEGEAEVAKGKLKTLLKQLRSTSGVHQDLFDNVQLLLGNLYLKEKDYESAITHYSQIVNINKPEMKDLQSHMLFAEARIEKIEPQLAVEIPIKKDPFSNTVIKQSTRDLDPFQLLTLKNSKVDSIYKHKKLIGKLNGIYSIYDLTLEIESSIKTTNSGKFVNSIPVGLFWEKVNFLIELANNYTHFFKEIEGITHHFIVEEEFSILQIFDVLGEDGVKMAQEIWKKNGSQNSPAKAYFHCQDLNQLIESSRNEMHKKYPQYWKREWHPFVDIAIAYIAFKLKEMNKAFSHSNFTVEYDDRTNLMFERLGYKKNLVENQMNGIIEYSRLHVDEFFRLEGGGITNAKEYQKKVFKAAASCENSYKHWMQTIPMMIGNFRHSGKESGIGCLYFSIKELKSELVELIWKLEKLTP